MTTTCARGEVDDFPKSKMAEAAVLKINKTQYVQNGLTYINDILHEYSLRSPLDSMGSNVEISKIQDSGRPPSWKSMKLNILWTTWPQFITFDVIVQIDDVFSKSMLNSANSQNSGCCMAAIFGIYKTQCLANSLTYVQQIWYGYAVLCPSNTFITNTGISQTSRYGRHIEVD